MRKVLTLFLIATALFVFSKARAQDAKSLYSALQQTQSDFNQESKVQTDLKATKQLLDENVKVWNQERQKLDNKWTELKMEIEKFKTDDSNLRKAYTDFNAKDADFRAQRASFKPQWDANQAEINRHNSWKPDRYNKSAVDAYNSEARQMQSVKDSLTPEKNRLDSWGKQLDAEEAVLKSKWDAKENKRKDINGQVDAGNKKESDLKWSREQISKQTEKWAKEQKESNAKINALVAKMNGILSQIARISECKGNFSPNVDITNLNGAAEQASRCLQMYFDGANRGNTDPVAPKPSFKVTPNK